MKWRGASRHRLSKQALAQAIVHVDVRLDGETVWLSLSEIAALFARDKSVIYRHLHNAFASGELEREAAVA